MHQKLRRVRCEARLGVCDSLLEPAQATGASSNLNLRLSRVDLAWLRPRQDHVVGVRDALDLIRGKRQSDHAAILASSRFDAIHVKAVVIDEAGEGSLEPLQLREFPNSEA